MDSGQEWQLLVDARLLIVVVHKVANACLLKTLQVFKCVIVFSDTFFYFHAFHEIITKANHMIPVLKKRREFLSVAQHKQMTKAKNVWVQIQPTASFENAPQSIDTSPIRFGFTASKKVGNAVKRNRAKRRLREIARLDLLPYLLNKNISANFVCIALQSTATCPIEDLKRDMLYSIKRNIKQICAIPQSTTTSIS